MIQSKVSHEQCMNCGACANVCPVDAISIDGNGWFYSLKTDTDRCIDCGQCLEVCPILSPVPYKDPIAAYSVIHQNKEIVRKSSSGGFFTAAADHMISDRGVVYGAVFGDAFRNIYIRSTEKESLEEIRRSKYVESLTRDSFRKVKQQLAQNIPILYTGTPCQIAGLKSYLGYEDENLLTCDFVCGGLPSHRVYREYLDQLEKSLKKKITNINFRPKSYGWENYGIRISLGDTEVYQKPAALDPFFWSFIYEKLSVRDACYRCPYNCGHISDLTMSDFWLYRKYTDGPVNHTGISLVICNTEKGERFVQECEDMIQIQPIELKNATYAYKEETFPEQLFMKRAEFFQACESMTIQQAARQVGMPTGKKALKYRIKGLVKEWLWGRS